MLFDDLTKFVKESLYPSHSRVNLLTALLQNAGQAACEIRDAAHAINKAALAVQRCAESHINRYQ
jgi:hypothetical protein